MKPILALMITIIGSSLFIGCAKASRVASLENQLNDAKVEIDTTNTNLTTLQGSVNSILVQLAELQGYKNIVSIKDPCGLQGSSINEIFLRLADGTYIASFSDNVSGLNTRFAVLTNGTYITTDGTGCTFTVSGGGTIINNEHN